MIWIKINDPGLTGARPRAHRALRAEGSRYHICFGNQNAPHTYDPALIDIIDLILTVNAGAHGIEASDVRHEHEWQVWRDVELPAGRTIAPGVIGHATSVVEHPELIAMRLIAMRLANFAGLVGRESVVASTDYGFSQGWNSPRVHAQTGLSKAIALKLKPPRARLPSRSNCATVC